MQTALNAPISLETENPGHAQTLHPINNAKIGKVFHERCILIAGGIEIDWDFRLDWPTFEQGLRADFNWMYGKERSGTDGSGSDRAPVTRSLPLPVPYRASTMAIKRIARQYTHLQPALIVFAVEINQRRRSPSPPRRRWQTKPACLTVISCETLRRGGRGLRRL